jgi:hypothetical protein
MSWEITVREMEILIGQGVQEKRGISSEKNKIYV